MGKIVYIDGNLLVTGGVLYGLNFCMYADETYRNIADEIKHCNADEIYKISENSGSMFTEYYVKGGITMYGENDSTIKSFKKEHEHTCAKFKQIQEQILLLLESAIIPDKCKNYFYHQQYISLYANLEYFLYNTFMWETCQCYESYKNVLPILAKYSRDSQVISILKGEHSILQEMTFVEQVKFIVYHRIKQVKEIYKAAFDIDVNLGVFNEELEIRNNIAHRAGYTKDGKLIQMSKVQVIALKNKIEEFVVFISQEISKFNDSKC